MGPVSDTNVPQEPRGATTGMSPMPSVPVNSSSLPTAGFDPSALPGTNADTTPEGVQSSATGRMVEAARLLREANPQLEVEACAVLAVLAGRRVAANPLNYGSHGNVPDGPITRKVKRHVNDLMSGEIFNRLAPGVVPAGRPPRATKPKRANPPAPGGHPPTPAPPKGTIDQVLDMIHLKPHERRMVDTVRTILQERKRRRNAPPGPGVPPIPAPPGVGDDEDIHSGEPLPDDIEPHDLNEDDQPGGRPDGAPPAPRAAVRHTADNPLDFGNRYPVPAGPVEQKAVQQVEKAEDTVGGFSSLPKPGEMPSMPGMGGGKSPKPGAAAAEADMAPMVAV